MKKLCPCHSSKAYSECCKPFHAFYKLPNPLETMRSRYAAYAMGNSAYIIKTTHPENPQYSENKQEWSASIHQFSSETKFVNLEIIEESEDAMEAFITFKATLVQGDRDASFTEKSRFLKVDGRWLYHSGTHF